MSDASALIGQTLDRYVVIERLGAGGVAGVFRARHRVLEREVALKVLDAAYRENAQLRERFRREAIAASRIKHPNVVTVEDLGETEDGLPYMVMELVEGQTLAQLIQSAAPMAPRRVARVAIQILEGLGAAHERGFVHRDLKPSNVIITEQYGRERIKILDFGAVHLRETPREERLTNAGYTVGTPAYMAPEQILDPAVGPAADLYSLGIILYEMLTGAPPFRGEKVIDVLTHQIQTPPPPLPELDGLGPLVLSLLEKRERERPRSASAVLLAIAQVLDGALTPELEPAAALGARPSRPPREASPPSADGAPATVPELPIDGLSASLLDAPPHPGESESGLPLEIMHAERPPDRLEPEPSPGASLEEPELPANLRTRVEREETGRPRHPPDDLMRLLEGD